MIKTCGPQIIHSMLSKSQQKQIQIAKVRNLGYFQPI